MTGGRPAPDGWLTRARHGYRLRWKRRELLWRAIRARHHLRPVVNRMAGLRPGAILCFLTLRNECDRLPEFLAHYRRLGVTHFLAVDNGSDDGSVAMMAAQPDASLWQTGASYRDTRFGMDWTGWLLLRYGHGHWCVTVDADELLIYPDHDRRDLSALTAHLDAVGQPGMGALMLDLFPRGPLDLSDAPPGAPLTDRLPWFDAGPYRARIVAPRLNLWVQGGARERGFFADMPDLSPTLNKLPLMRWNRRYAYVNSTHSALPVRLNQVWDGPGDPRVSGVLLHGKFLPQIVAKSHEELARRQHFADPDAYAAYHHALGAAPILWHADAHRYTGWRQMMDLGLMGGGGWQRG